MNAKEAKNRFGVLLEEAQRGPVSIHKNGRPVAVLLSVKDYERFEEVEAELWSR